jgi:septum formation protein
MLLANLKGKKIILASKSPRRQGLVAGLDIDCEVQIRDVEEVYPDDLPLHEVPEYLAKLKASAWGDDLESQLIITADTVVIHDGRILGKPKDRDQAMEMLHSLSGKTHEVVTGVAITTSDKKMSFSDTTKVTFAELTPEEIGHYIDKYEPYDKAGSYGAQEFIGYIAITRLEGSYFNVMGLPVHRLFAELKKF